MSKHQFIMRCVKVYKMLCDTKLRLRKQYALKKKLLKFRVSTDRIDANIDHLRDKLKRLKKENRDQDKYMAHYGIENLVMIYDESGKITYKVYDRPVSMDDIIHDLETR